LTGCLTRIPIVFLAASPPEKQSSLILNSSFKAEIVFDLCIVVLLNIF